MRNHESWLSSVVGVFFTRAGVQYNRFLSIADVTVRPRRSALRLTAVANAAVTHLRDVKEKLSHQRCEYQ